MQENFKPTLPSDADPATLKAEPAAPGGAADPSLDKAAPKKRELPSRKNTSVRNLVWAVGLNMLIAVMIAAVIVGVGRQDRNQTAQTQALIDLPASAQRASETLAFAAVQAVPENWRPTQARIESVEPAIWGVKYSSGEGRLVTLFQSNSGKAALYAKVPGEVTPGEPVAVAGKTCVQLQLAIENAGDEVKEQAGVECELADSVILIFGGVSEATILELASSL